MVLVLLLFAIIPATAVGIFTYKQSYDTVYEATKQDLEERMDFCLRTCRFYNEMVRKGEITKEEAISKIADLLAGPLQPDGTRDINQSLGKGKEGYVNADYSNYTFAFHPYRKGSIYDISDPEIRKSAELVPKATSREWHTYKWFNPDEKKYYSKVMVLDYFEPFDLHFCVSTTMDEFIAPILVTRRVSIITIILVGAIALVFSLFEGNKIAKPFIKLSETSAKITKGDLSARVDTKSPIKELSSVSKDINLMADSLQNRIEELNQTLESSRDILNKVAQKGDLSARIDANALSGKYKQIGESINKIVESMQSNIEELRKREEEIEASRTYFRHFFNASPVPLTLIGLDGKRRDCNPAMERLTGRRREELVNIPVEATYVKEEQPLVRKKLVDETIEKGYMHGFETYFKRPDGIMLPIIANTTLIRDKDGKPLSIIYSAADISELKKREEELKEIRESLEREAARIAASIVENLRRISQMGTPNP
jgi:PAS domain S-box-containing protein